MSAALANAAEARLNPISVVVLDSRACVKAAASQDGVSLMRDRIAHGKAYGSLAMGVGSRALYERAQEQQYFISAVNTLAEGRLVPVPGGVLIYGDDVLLGSIGISGDSSDNDEACAVSAIDSAGLQPRTA